MMVRGLDCQSQFKSQSKFFDFESEKVKLKVDLGRKGGMN